MQFMKVSRGIFLDMSIKRFGKNLLFVREFLSISKAYLSEETGISQKKILLIENGFISPSEEEIKLICEYLLLTKKFMLSHRSKKQLSDFLKNHELNEYRTKIVYYKKINCIRCDKKFKSYSNFNKICDKCKADFREKKIDNKFETSFIFRYKNE